MQAPSTTFVPTHGSPGEQKVNEEQNGNKEQKVNEEQNGNKEQNGNIRKIFSIRTALDVFKNQ